MKGNATLSIISIILVIIIGFLGYQLWNSHQIIAGSDLVEATLVESKQVYTQDSTKTSGSDEKKKTYYVTTVYQHMVVEYQLNGQTVKRDIGNVKVGEATDRTRSARSASRSNYMEMYKKPIGEKMNVYVTKNGEVHMASEVDATQRKSVFMLIGMGVVLIVLNLMRFGKKRRA